MEEGSTWKGGYSILSISLDTNLASGDQQKSGNPFETALACPTTVKNKLKNATTTNFHIIVALVPEAEVWVFYVRCWGTPKIFAFAFLNELTDFRVHLLFPQVYY